jgi:hypothetical protein
VVTGVRVYLHPDWAWAANWPATPVSDLALVELDRAVWLPPQRLAPDTVDDADPVRLVGWGLTTFPPPPGGDPRPAILQERDTTALPAASCEGGFIGTGEICVGNGACFGDSGSPALRRVGSPRWTEVGLDSRETQHTDPCGRPAVYTDTAYPPFRTWIRHTITTRRILPCTCPPVTTPDPAAQDRITALTPTINR